MFTVDELVSQVRDQIQETNEGSVDDDMILAALNRGNSYAWNVYARHYPEPLIVRQQVTLNSDGQTFDIPDNAFEQRLQKVEMTQGSIVYELERMGYRRTTGYRNNVVGSRPVFYSIRGRLVELLPKPSSTSGYTYHSYHIRRPDELVTEQGRITQITAVTGGADANIVVDAVGSRLTTSDPYLKYVNFVDGLTGEVKGTAEIKTISGTQITFKQSVTRSSVLGRTVDTDVPSDLTLDDYITDINGSCVVFFQQPTTNFLIQYAVSEIRRALGYDTGVEKNALKDFEDQVRSTWAGREANLKVKATSRIWRN